MKEIIENDRIDLAFNYLKVGEFRPDALRLGPSDYSRAQQLADIERTIADPDAFHGMEQQLVTEALVAAKLSRALEHPRFEIDGRFARAIRLAGQHGTYRQKLEAEYEQIWTAFWWFDDIAFLNSAYDAFQDRALESNSASDLAFLGNLHQLLVNCVVHGLMSQDECQFDDRTAKLRQALQPLGWEAERPNNSLEAQTELLRIELNEAMIARDRQALSTIWPKYTAVLDKAVGLGEFDAETLVRFIEAPAPFVGNDPAYNDLVEKLAAFVGARKSEGEGALILLRRAKSLDLSDWPDMIRWLGKAAVGLSKREYTPALIEAMYLLSVAYRHARLPWASRASCISTAASIVIEGEEDSQLPVSIVPTMKLWAWNALGLCHIPDFLFAIQLLNGLVPALSEESKAKVQNDLRELNLALGCMLLNLSEDDLRRLERLPDILEGLGLFTARIALLYALGHEDVLRADGSLPEEESDEAVRDLLSKLKSQPITRSLKGPLLLNDDAPRIMVTTIVGMRVEVEIPDDRFIPVAESILSSLEAFFATALDRATPHTERFRIAVAPGGDTDNPRITTNRSEHTSAVAWPPSLSIAQPGRQDDVRRFLLQVAAHVMDATCVVNDPQAFLEELCASESVLQRMMMVTLSQNSFSRVTSQRFLRLSEWQEAGRRSYPFRQERRDLPASALPDPEDEPNSETTPGSPPKLSHHRQPRIRSVIDVHAWNEARWRGCGYPYPLRIPVMSLLFENSAPARNIFERWRARFGREDADEEITVSIIINLPGAAPHHYCVQITARHPELDANADHRPTIMTSRSTTMEPASSENLDRFLREYSGSGAYFLMPAVGFTDTKLFSDLAIFKRRLVVKSAAEVEEHDLESMALRIRGLKFAS